MLDNVVRAAGLDNVTFIQSDFTYYVNFSLRDWNAHLRHGHDASLEHIGTSAGKQRWQAWMLEHDFDIAFRGHYHMLKEEPVAGQPVIMGGSIAPTSEFEESRAITGRPAAAVHGVTDEQVLDWTERIYF
jgi:predicted phosphodiesterase